MCWKCQPCGKVAEPHTPRQVHTYYRTDVNGRRQISQEINVCDACKRYLGLGVSYYSLLRSIRRNFAVPVAPVAATRPKVTGGPIKWDDED